VFKRKKEVVSKYIVSKFVKVKSEYLTFILKLFYLSYAMTK